MKKKSMRFQDELRKSLIVHALVPCILSLVVLVGIFTAIGMFQIIHQSTKAVREYSKNFGDVLSCYIEKNKMQSQNLNLSGLEENPWAKAELASDIYQFLNAQKIRGDFYLLKPDGTCLFSTQNNQLSIRSVFHYLKWTDGDKDGKAVFFYDIYGEEIMPALFIFNPVAAGGETAGYCGFVLRAEPFAANSGSQELSILAVNRFRRIFTPVKSAFSDSRGKLSLEFWGKNQLLRFRERWYYVSSSRIFGEDLWVYGIYDCNAFIQLCMISMAMVCGMAVILCFAIYRSAGTAARKKTLIIYELVDALNQVEKGNLEVSLDISTGDEFEYIGNSFHMMLGSLRHLIARHEEMARENTLATVQMLESQFNPHFLFNTLDSIRWLVRLAPEDAEQMLVSLSRLLRYSIQNERDYAQLWEELHFVEQYLKIMLYRYMERLRYTIEVGRECREILVPRMILQPLVENSVKYGFSEKKEQMNIFIRAWVDKENLQIAIIDDGAGIEPNLLKSLRDNLKQSHNRTEHVGIYNVNRRMQLMYGISYGVRIESGENGTELTLTIPVNGNTGQN